MKSLRLLAVLLGFFAAPAAGQAEVTALTGVRIYASPTAEAIDDGAIVIRDGRIEAVGRRGEVKVPANAEVIAAPGATALAGFWNSHVHLLTPRLLKAKAATAADLSADLERMFTAHGFSTVFDIGSSLSPAKALRARIRAGEIRGPRILTVGDPIFPKGGTPIYVRELFAREGIAGAEPKTAAEAGAAVGRQITAGADGVKLFTGAIVGGEIGVLPMDAAVAKAAVDAAHARGKPVFAHPTNGAGLEIALGAGVDILAHPAPFAPPFDEAMVERLTTLGTALIPTLHLFEVAAEQEGLDAAATAALLDKALAQVRALHEAGGRILFGTDAGYIDDYGTAAEIRLMGQAGLSWRDILASLTTEPAAMYGDASRGRIEPGMIGDIVLVDGDPAADPVALSKVRRTLSGGETIYAGPAQR